MEKEEIKLQCMRFACDIAGVSQGFSRTTEEVIVGAEEIYKWVEKTENDS